MSHQHEPWQLQSDANGNQYCAACGESVPDDYIARWNSER